MNRRKTVLAVIIIVFALSAFIAVAGSATEMSDILTVAFNLIKGSTASSVLSVGFSLIKSAGSSITAGLSVGFSLVKSAISSATTTLSVGFSLIKSGISSALSTLSVGFALVKETILSAFATIGASFHLIPEPTPTPTPPPVDFKVLTSCNCPVYINQTAEFNANVSGEDATPPYTYNWDFGDGNTTIEETNESYIHATHIYPSYWHSWHTTVAVTDSAGHTAKDTVKCCVLRKKTDDTIASIDDSPYYALISALTGYEGAINESAVPDFFGFAESTVTPYTNIVGNLFFVIFFGVFFLMLWLRQENIMIPSVIGIIAGGALLGFAPAEFHLPAILLVSFSIFGVIYSMLKERS